MRKRSISMNAAELKRQEVSKMAAPERAARNIAPTVSQTLHGVPGFARQVIRPYVSAVLAFFVSYAERQFAFSLYRHRGVR